MLIERDGKRPGQRIGKSPWLQSVVVETDAAAGEMVTVDIVAAGPNSVTGAIVDAGGWRGSPIGRMIVAESASEGSTIVA